MGVIVTGVNVEPNENVGTGVFAVVDDVRNENDKAGVVVAGAALDSVWVVFSVVSHEE
jgi:hypothetical protein